MLFAGPPAPLWHASDHQSMLSCHIMIHCEPRNILENVNGIFSLGFITVHIFIYTLMIFYWSSWEPKLWQWQETNPAASAGICIQPAVLLLISDRRFANICFHSWTKIKKMTISVHCSETDFFKAKWEAKSTKFSATCLFGFSLITKNVN